MTSVSLSQKLANADALVVGVSGPSESPPVVAENPALSKAFRGAAESALRTVGASTAVGDVTKLAGVSGAAAPVVLAVGLGPGRTPDVESLRRAAGSAVRALAGTATVAVALPSPDAAAVAEIAMGSLLGAYTFTRYRSSDPGKLKAPVTTLLLLTPAAKDKAARAAVARAEVVARAVHLTRDLINTAPGDLHPADLADAAVAAAAGLPVEVEVLDEAALAAGGYGGILGVGQGSTNPPRLVRMIYRPRKARGHLAFVGKGITFDSGGISLKPPLNMHEMKSDMSGAAAVIAAVAAIARLELDVAVTGWAAIAENMPSGSAQRPADVLTMYGGRSVEVLNTDAEGRLVLADALVRAAEEQPDAIVDVATLTGAQVVALGTRVSAIMSNSDDLRTRLHELADQAGEAMWPMPLPADLRSSLDSDVADLANIGERMGGMLVAGIFLQEFIPEGTLWAHLDIAGPSFNSGTPYGYTPKGGTGAAVRTLIALAEEHASGGLLR